MFHGGTALSDRRHDVIVKQKIAPSAKPCTKTKEVTRQSAGSSRALDGLREREGRALTSRHKARTNS